jgi:DNA-binding NarL/FixJ family response regulator
MPRLRVVIADDHKLVAEAFGKLLQRDFDIVGVCGDGRELLQAAAELAPDVAILDLGMPILNGMDATAHLRRALPKLKVLVLTMNDDPLIAAEALRRGASAFLLKTSGLAELTKAIREAMRGMTYITPQVARKMEDEWIRNPSAERETKLTSRQREVLQLLAQGQTMKEVAANLRIATRTVAFHKYKIMEDFRIRSNADLVQLAIREHMLAVRLSPSQPQLLSHTGCD